MLIYFTAFIVHNLNFCLFVCLFVCRHRDIHVALEGINVKDRKEAAIEIKWDANRDPGQKFAAAVEFIHPERLNYSGSFLMSYPGRTLKGNFHFAIKGTLKVILPETFKNAGVKMLSI